MHRLIASLCVCLVVLNFSVLPALAQESTGNPGASAPVNQASAAAEAAASASQAQVISSGTEILDAATLGAVSSLSVLQGATAIIDFSNLGSITLPGDFTNAGTVYAVSSNGVNSTAHLTAANILTQQNSLLTTVLPQGGLPGLSNLLSSLNLSLTALQDIVNAGTISSAANLSIAAGGSIVNQATIAAAQNVNLTSNLGNIVNSGTISALSGNINMNSQLAQLVASQVTQNLTVNITGGVMQALNGAINMATALDAMKADLTLSGGKFLSKELNLKATEGVVRVAVDEITGQLNITGCEAHTLVSSGNLNLGSITLTGDPTFYNDALNGDVTIGGNISVGEALTIVASRDILSSGDFTIQSNNGSRGFDINLIAGANITAAAGGTSGTVGPGSGTSATWSGTGTPATGTVTIDGASSTGGSIDFSNRNMTISSAAVSGSNPGGNVRLIAYADSSTGTSGGKVLLSSGSSTLSGGSGSGANGNVTIIAGALSGSDQTTISTGRIDTTGGTGSGGAINISTGQPTFTIGSSMDFDTQGNISSGNDFEASAPSASDLSIVTINNDLVSGSSVNIYGSQAILEAPFLAGQLPSIARFFSVPRVTPDGTLIYYQDTTLTPTNGTSLRIVSTSNFQTVDTIPLPGLSYATLMSPDGQYVYAVRVAAGSDDVGATGSIVIVRTSDNTVVSNTDLGTTYNDIRQAALSPDGSKLYIGSKHGTAAGQINAYDVTDPENPELVDTGLLPASYSPDVITPDPKGRFLFVGNGNGFVSAPVVTLDAETLATLDFDLGFSFDTANFQTMGLVVDPSGKYLAVAAANFTTFLQHLEVLDLDLNKRVSVPFPPTGFLDRGLAINPQGTHLFVHVDNGAFNTFYTLPLLGSALSSPSAVLTDSFGYLGASYGGDHLFITSGGGGDVLKLPQIVAPTAHLETRSTAGNTKSILTSTSVQSLGVEMSAASGVIGIAQRGAVNLTSAPANVDAFNLATAGPAGSNITLSDALTSDAVATIRLVTTSLNSSIAINADIAGATGNNISQVSVFNTAPGGGITQLLGTTINFPHTSLNFATILSLGSIDGDIGSSGAPINAVVSGVIANTGGSANFLNLTLKGAAFTPLSTVPSRDIVSVGESIEIGSITFQGTADTALFAAGQNIVVTGSITAESTAVLNNLVLIAGADRTFDQLNGVVVTGGSETGGSVETEQITTNGGNLVVAAYFGSGMGSGTITLGSPINTATASSTLSNGSVTLIAGATSGTSITTDDITTSGPSINLNAGNVTLLTATPVINSPGSITMPPSNLGSFAPNPPFATSGPAIVLTKAGVNVGNISASGQGSATGNGGAGGSATIRAGGALQVDSVSTFGGGGFSGLSSAGDGGSGGAIVVEGGGTVSISGAVNSGGGGGGSILDGTSGGGGGGSITVRSPVSIVVSGPVLAAGGGNGSHSLSGGGSFGGAGGTLGSGSSTPGSGMGGHDVGEPFTSGAGGVISLDSPSITVSGTVGASANGWPGFPGTTYAGDSINALGAGGEVAITPDIAVVSAAYTADANYAEGASTYEITITGASLSVVGDIQAGSGPGEPITIHGTDFGSPVPAGIYTGGTTITIEEDGNPVAVNDGDFVTPAEAIALVQVSQTGLQTIILSQPVTVSTPGTGFASGGSFDIEAANVPVGNFTNLNLPSGVTADVGVASLTYTGSALIDGTMNFSTSGAQLNVGTTTTVGGSVHFNGTAGGSIVSGGAITGTGTLFAATGGLSLTSTGGGIGTDSGNRLPTSTSKLDLVSAPGDVFIENTGALELVTTSGAGAFFLTNDTDLSVSGAASRGAIDISTTSGTITLTSSGSLTALNGAAGIVNLSASNVDIQNAASIDASGGIVVVIDGGTLTNNGSMRNSGSNSIIITSTPGQALRLDGTGAIRQDAATPGFTVFLSDTGLSLGDGMSWNVQSSSGFTVAPIYIDAPAIEVDSGGTATMTSDGGAWSIAPQGGAGSILFDLGTMNFNGGPLYVQATDITLFPAAVVATNSYLGFIVTDDGDILNNGTITATGSCAGCNGVNQFFLGFGDLDLFGTSGVFNPGTQGVAFTVNNGFQLSLAAGLNWQMTSGGLAFFQGSTVKFGAGSLFRATNNATISVSAPVGSNLTIVLPDNATAELRNNGGIMGIVPQTSGSSIFFNNSNLISVNTATLLLNTTLAAPIYVGAFAPGSTNIAPNVDINSTPSPIIYFGTVNGLTRSITDTTAEPSLKPAIDPSEEEEGENATGKTGTASRKKADYDKDDEGGGLKPVAYIHGGAAPSQEMLTEKQVAADALITGRVRLDGQALEALRNRGVSAWQEGDAIRLDAGSLLLAPSHDVVVRTPEGDVHIDAGSAVYMMSSSNRVAIYNLHDDHGHAVRMEIAGQRLSVHAGRHLVLTRNALDGFGTVNPLGKLGYRQVKEHKLGNGLRAFQGEFSLVSALRTIGGARELLASAQGGHRELSGRLMKTAAIQAYMSARSGAFASAR